MKKIAVMRSGAAGFLIAAAICFTVALSAEYLLIFHARGLSVSVASASDEQEEKYPYGGSKGGTYGEKRSVKTKEDAEKVLKEYFAKKDVVIGKVKEKDLYFEAEILDKKGNMIDKVIVNKRTGRIRSIF
jgi:hypothetical protein